MRVRSRSIRLLITFVAASAALSCQSGRGAEPQSKVPSFVSAADFGAKPGEFGDAAKVVEMPDATDAIQTALDAGAHGTVFLPKGHYRVTRPLSMKAGTTFQGEGLGGTVLTSEKAMSAVIHLKGVHGPMTVIRDLFFGGPLGGNWQCDAIFLEGTNGVTVRDCWFGAWRRAVRLDGVSDHWLRNIVFELNQEGIVVDQPQLGRWHGNLRLFDCYGYQNYQGAIRIKNIRGLQIQGCSSVGSGYFLWLKGCANVAVSGASVNWDGSPYARFGLMLEDCSLVTVSGCNIEGQKEAGLRAVKSRQLSLRGNLISNTRNGPGVWLEQCSQSTVSENVITESAGHGIRVSSCAKLVLASNVVSSYGQGEAPHDPASSNALLCDGESRDCILTDNVITPTPGAGVPIRLGEKVQEVRIRDASAAE